jgi:hypothetical protein
LQTIDAQSSSVIHATNSKATVVSLQQHSRISHFVSAPNMKANLLYVSTSTPTLQVVRTNKTNVQFQHAGRLDQQTRNLCTTIAVSDTLALADRSQEQRRLRGQLFWKKIVCKRAKIGSPARYTNDLPHYCLPLSCYVLSSSCIFPPTAPVNQ